MTHSLTGIDHVQQVAGSDLLLHSELITYMCIDADSHLDLCFLLLI